MTAKITVSLPDEQVELLKAAVRDGQAKSVSSIVSHALQVWAERESLAQYLAHLEEVHGPIPEEDRQWARRALSEA